MTEMKSNSQPVKCLGCGRKLKAKASIAQQRGPRCQARWTAATAEALASLDLSAFTGEQVVKAAELIAENAIVAASSAPLAADRPNVYRAMASSGQLVYFTTAVMCSCKAGQYGRPCYHRAAALVLDTVAAA
jgi:hypothetical protein